MQEFRQKVYTPAIAPQNLFWCCLQERLNSTLSTVQSLLAKVKQVDQDVVQNALQVNASRAVDFSSVLFFLSTFLLITSSKGFRSQHPVPRKAILRSTDVKMKSAV